MKACSDHHYQGYPPEEMKTNSEGHELGPHAKTGCPLMAQIDCGFRYIFDAYT